MSNTVKLNNDHNQLIDNLCDDPRVAMDKNTINAALLEMGYSIRDCISKRKSPRRNKSL